MPSLAGLLISARVVLETEFSLTRAMAAEMNDMGADIMQETGLASQPFPNPTALNASALAGD
jgi:type II secretory pathway component PulM